MKCNCPCTSGECERDENECEDCGTTEDVDYTYCHYNADMFGQRIGVHLCSECYADRVASI